MAKIMVIDDDLNIRQIVSRFMRHAGHQVVTVADGIFAMKAIREEQPDLIILDVIMPELDGCALGYHLKFKSEFASIPLIMLTSLVDKPYLGKDIAADCFMGKPFSGEALIDKVNELLSSPKVNVGVEQDEAKSGGGRRITSATAAGIAMSIAVVLFAVLSLSRATAAEQPAVTAAFSQGDLADQLFIYTLPVALALFGYIAYALTRLVMNNPKPNGK